MAGWWGGSEPLLRYLGEIAITRFSGGSCLQGTVDHITPNRPRRRNMEQMIGRLAKNSSKERLGT